VRLGGEDQLHEVSGGGTDPGGLARSLAGVQSA
jgi:hypothetical protein